MLAWVNITPFGSPVVPSFGRVAQAPDKARVFVSDPLTFAFKLGKREWNCRIGAGRVEENDRLDP
jgi:hypothetical protein